MKVMSVNDSGPADSLLLTFHGVLDPRVALTNALEPFLDALERHAVEWMPDVVDGKRRRRYSRPSFWKSLEEGRDEGHMDLGLYRTRPPALDGRLEISLARQPPELDLYLRVEPLALFAGTESSRALIELVRAWACHYLVTHASAHSIADRELAGDPDFGRKKEDWHRDGFDKVYELFWLNVFGPKLVEAVGRERMLSTPAHRVEQLPNGSVLLVTWPTAADFAREEARLAQARAHVHLRPDLDFNTVLRTLRERSTTLMAVEPRFPPDLDPLLSRVVDLSPHHERQRRIAEFNAWRPPHPSEWLPAERVLPLGTVASRLTLEPYRLQGEQLVAMLHTDVPSLMQRTPESLTDLDVYFWRDDSPKRRQREILDKHVIPAVGSYLGEMLVRHLKGRWIPQPRHLETGVLVGHRIWLPFVRAQHYLRSRQSLLDHSLTQFYREAERHGSAG